MKTKPKTISNFTNKFQLSKTLRFELKPIGETLNQIKAKGLLTKDAQRAKSYKSMKETIDEFHKYFIEIAMNSVNLSNLEDFSILYYESNLERKKEDSYKKELAKVQEQLRKEIVKGFKEGEAKEIFSKLFKKEIITELLEIYHNENPDSYYDEEFKTFTTYFTGFHENRKNIYTDKEQSTAIAFRLIHENLPKFLDNVKVFNKLIQIPQFKNNCKELYKNIETYLNITKIDEAFEINYFNNTLTQKDIDVYNLIIGGKSSKENEKKIQGLNEYINLYNQKQEKKNRLPKLKMLYKQILSDRDNISFLPDKFENSQDVLDAIENYFKANLKEFQPKDSAIPINILESLKELVASIPSYQIDKIYIKNDTSLTKISQTLFNDWGVIKAALEFDFLKGLTIGKKGLSKKQETEIDKYLKQNYFSIQTIENALLNYKEQDERLINLKDDDLLVANYFNKHFKATQQKDNEKVFDLIANIDAKYSCIKGLLAGQYPEDKDLKQDQKTIDNIKLFLDSLMELLHFVKPIAIPIDFTQGDKDEAFYTSFNTLYEQLQLLVPLYNKVRNYATQKPYSVEKYKLNFDNAQLLAGWDANKEKDYLTSILVKDGLYYLSIMDKKNNKVLQNLNAPKTGDYYEKVIYKLLPGVNKMLPKVFFSNKNIDFFNPSEELLNKYKAGTHKKGDNFSLQDCHNLIDFFKESLNKHKDWKNFNFQFSSTETYDDLSYFYREVGQQGYKITYDKVAVDDINTLVNEGKLYLFQIYNKDFSPYSKGKPNMHTLYWKALFDENNLKNVVYKLNGQAEMFYRQKSITDNIVVHKANEAIKNKNPLNKKENSTFNYDITKDKRYTEDKFLFHVPITMNFKATGNDYINADVLTYLQNNPEVNIIGLDRGERHLIYLSLMNQKGEVLKDEKGLPIQFTLNDIVNEHNGNTYKTNYQNLLDTKEKERDKARKNWGSIENIKELKEGYISQVVHKIAHLMVKYNAIVVMEDLNFGFKRGRFKVEKQVYQKLEKMLIDKLNYLVFKDKNPNDTAGLYNALQLTNKFKSFKDMGKQSGFLFYVPAWNTSKIDPTTGFVNLFNTKYENLEKAKAFFSNFKSIKFNEKENFFEFDFDYNNFTARAEGTKTNWTVCTYGDRILTFRNSEKNNEWDNQSKNLTTEFIQLFTTNNIDYKANLKEQILNKENAKFFKDLLFWFKLTLQMRNSITNSEVDYLISPVKNNEGYFYDSRTAKNNLPKDADANGAYHIAKKGLWMLQQINNYENNDNWKKLKLAVSNKDWLNFVQNN